MVIQIYQTLIHQVIMENFIFYKAKRWYQLPDIPGEEPIGYGSDIVVGEEVEASPPVPAFPYVKIYISKGGRDQVTTSREFWAYYFSLPLPDEGFLPGDDTIEVLIRRSYFKRLADFEHGLHSRMTYNPSFNLGGGNFRKEIYALRGLPGAIRGVLRYDIATNTWDSLTKVPWTSLYYPSIGMFGVIGNRRAPEPHRNFSHFFVLRGDYTKHVQRYYVDQRSWINTGDPDYIVTNGKIVYGLYCHSPGNPGVPKDGMWAFFCNPQDPCLIGFLKSLGEEEMEEE